jgi:SAM-dependent methyltransferase
VSAPTDKWSGDGAGEHYCGPRFASRAAAERDPRTVERLLARHGVRGPILDAPCGTGRLTAGLARHGVPVTALDVSASMLAAATPLPNVRFVRGRVDALPFPDRSFDVVVSCRFLHHLHSSEALAVALGELVRVSERLVIASFWDASSFPQWRVRAGLKRAEGSRGRRAISRHELRGLLVVAGANVLEFRTGMRFVTQQTFFVAERAR